MEKFLYGHVVLEIAEVGAADIRLDIPRAGIERHERRAHDPFVVQDRIARGHQRVALAPVREDLHRTGFVERRHDLFRARLFALIVIMSVTPWSSVVPEKSPFVELFVLVGLPAAASVINFVVLTSAASSANSGVFSTSRMLFGLAQEGVAPKAFAKLSKRAVPAKGLTFSCICLLGGVVMLYVNPSVIGAFTMITTVSAILFMFVWTIILCSYLVYRKQRPHLHEKSIYKMPLGKLMCWVCMAFFVFVVVLLTLEDDTRQALLVTPLWFIALGLGWLFIGKKRAAELRK